MTTERNPKFIPDEPNDEDDVQPWRRRRRRKFKFDHHALWLARQRRLQRIEDSQPDGFLECRLIDQVTPWLVHFSEVASFVDSSIGAESRTRIYMTDKMHQDVFSPNTATIKAFLESNGVAVKTVPSSVVFNSYDHFVCQQHVTIAAEPMSSGSSFQLDGAWQWLTDEDPFDMVAIWQSPGQVLPLFNTTMLDGSSTVFFHPFACVHWNQFSKRSTGPTRIYFSDQRHQDVTDAEGPLTTDLETATDSTFIVVQLSLFHTHTVNVLETQVSSFETWPATFRSLMHLEGHWRFLQRDTVSGTVNILQPPS
jgi:hypothetical protein